ncbi:pseudouridine synthase [Herbaspirillum sp. SJZ099]|uniref:pseudouridine synthase n=1 Tax=Herbaspirillum sp. SJZ099 TaxID=2572916 RepID=UPI0011A14991|nr:pseudouridine synthase [Herbaspirillum sp. SJZ099]TWC71802.1 tRNA pseudouridine32 synthase/23S rRNA pseudouridine746 synthase [Herbaspirillum sp. SJZ099]
MRPTPTLPVRDGLAPSYLWLQPGPWPDMLSFLAERFTAVPPPVWRERLLRGEVRNQRGEALRPETPYRSGDCIFYYRQLPQGEARIPVEEKILHIDDHLLVADKPHFLPVIPTGRFVQETLLVRLKKATGLEHLTPIHRLDRETAGVIVFSHHPDSRGKYQSMFQRRAMYKVYEAIAPLRAELALPLVHRSRVEEIPGQFFKMHEAPGEPNSETHISLVEPRGELGLYRLEPVTGRRHQLRVHMASLGIPILNDLFYPEAVPVGVADDLDKPLKLLARSLFFIDPLDGSERHFRSERTL